MPEGKAAEEPSQDRLGEAEAEPGEESSPESARGGYAPVEDLLKSALTRPERHSAGELAAQYSRRAGQLHQRGQHRAARHLWEVARLCRQSPDAPLVQLLEEAHVPPGQRSLVARAAELDHEAEALASGGQQSLAGKLREQALQIREDLYPESRYPYGNVFLAQSLSAVGQQLTAQGDYPRARAYLEHSLAMLEPRSPDGHPYLAQVLNQLGWLHCELGEYAQARPYLERALAMSEVLYAPREFPRGHPDLARSLDNLGELFRLQGDFPKALSYSQRGLAMREALYPRHRHPKGHPDLAASSRRVGLLFIAQADHEHGLLLLQQALAMCEGLYPKDQYPKGHGELIRCLRYVGAARMARREYRSALPYLRRALTLCEALYPATDYPKGHPLLIESLESLADLVRHLEGNPAALRYRQRALALCEVHYAREHYPHGHPKLAANLLAVGVALALQRNFQQALPYLQRALVMSEQLYPRNTFPQGHPLQAMCLLRLGAALLFSEPDERGLAYLRRAVAVCQALYSAEEYPHGHPDLALSLRCLGAMLHLRGEYQEALPYLRRALAMDQALADSFVAGASEAEALNFAATLPLVRDLLLSTPDTAELSEDDLYAPVWRGKAAVARILRRRQEALADGAGPLARQLWQDLLDVRRGLSQLLLAPAGPSGERLTQLRQLTSRKEDLERRLAQSLPRRSQLLGLPPHDDLVKKLPPGTAFIDLLRYVRIERTTPTAFRPGWRATPTYVAFLLTPGRPVRRVDLGPAKPIETTLTQWRQDIAEQRSGTAADVLSGLLWEPLSRHMPAGTHTVIVAPDGALTRLPWAALPGRAAGRVLLEDYAVAVVPHGPFLLTCLGPPPRPKEPGVLLAVGGIRYGAESASGGAGHGPGKLIWPPLPHTREEVATLVELAGERPVLTLTGREPSPGRLLAELPRARHAHLATHGFFAGPDLRSVLQLDERLYERAPFGVEQTAPGSRNPLVLSGLVLAGAAVQPEDDDRPLESDCILTAEAVASLPLQDLELVVLSACETGLGAVAGGEGVFGLQRAFHMAGAHAVVASLWKVDDTATQALMAEFYRNLWQRGLGKLQALRQAQLALLRSFDQKQARPRGAGPERPIAPEEEGRPWPDKGVPPRFWAAWVLSGDLGDLSPEAAPPAAGSESPFAAAAASRARVTSVLKGLSVSGALLAAVLVVALLVRRRRRPAPPTLGGSSHPGAKPGAACGEGNGPVE
jgi:CHAT domain-containing protein